MITVGIFVLGLVTGSFLNVCIQRIPRGEPVLLPSSQCPSCHTPPEPYDNIAVLSWLLLRGKCRKCQAKISGVYPAVELLTALLFVACYFTFDAGVEALKWAIFSSLLIVLAITNVRDGILPDKVNFTGLGLGIALSFFTRTLDGTAAWLSSRLFAFPFPPRALSFADGLLGAAVGSGLLWVVAEGYFRLRGREGLGLGNVKLMALVGAFLGVKRTIATLIGGFLLAVAIGLYLLVGQRKTAETELPFGTVLSVTALLLVFQDAILHWLSWLLVRASGFLHL